MGAETLIDGDKGAPFFSTFGGLKKKMLTDLLIFLLNFPWKISLAFVKIEPIEIDWIQPPIPID